MIEVLELAKLRELFLKYLTQVFNGTDLDMVMGKFDKAVKKYLGGTDESN